ncbi:MAG TPA: tRNA 2-thiouridine(34) synthase MnmA, partial [Hellea balneolensis]|nr:tRNA 2-thiouridine(34) synthase MnmA [Hellea balneolensis]
GQELDGQAVHVKTRSMRPPVSARFTWVEDQVVVDLDEPLEGIAPGQACVFYDAETTSRTLGGGWITKAR